VGGTVVADRREVTETWNEISYTVAICVAEVTIKWCGGEEVETSTPCLDRTPESRPVRNSQKIASVFVKFRIVGRSYLVVW
jgi:hypothetical protein